MKKTLLLLCAAFSMTQTMFGLTIEAGKYYYIKANSDKKIIAFMADNESDGNRISGVEAITDACYWTFESTGNPDCYNIKNKKTGRYIQGYSASGAKVTMGVSPVEYYVKTFDGIGGRFYFAVTSYTPHDFNEGTIGLNLAGESNEANCYVQSYGAVQPGNGRSQWTLIDIEELTEVNTTKVYTISNKGDGYTGYYIKDKGETNLAAETSLDNACLWQFEDAGSGQFYVKNVKTGRYAQACSNSTKVAVTMGETPVAYVVVNCGAQEDVPNCFGLTSANHSNIAFTKGCVGWNLDDGNKVVQSFDAQAGTNHKSFWIFTEYEPQTIGSEGYASYGNTSEDVIILGAQAYKGTRGTSWLTLTEVSDVHANYGVIIQGSLYAVASIASASSDMSDNDLLVSNGSITGDGKRYALSTLGGTAPIGFYLVGEGIHIPAGKAFLEAGGGNVKGFTFVFDDDDATSMNEELRVKNEESETAIFNLVGQRVQKMQKGINIVNGKKILK